MTEKEAEERDKCVDELAEAYRNTGDADTLAQLWEAVKRFVFKLALKYRDVAGVELEDLKQEGFIYVEAAARSYDREKGHFAPLLALSVRHGLYRYIQQTTGAFRIPEVVALNVGRVSRFEAEFKAKHGRMPTREEIREAMELTPAEVAAVYQARKRDNTESIFAPLPGTEGTMTRADTIADEHRPQEDVETAFDNEIIGNILWQIIDEEGTGDLFRECYKNGRTRKEAAAILKITEKEARNAEWRTMNALRNSLCLKKYYYLDSKIYTMNTLGRFRRTNTSGVEALALGLF